MDWATKKFQERREAVHRIRAKKHYKVNKNRQTVHHSHQHPQLPPITNGIGAVDQFISKQNSPKQFYKTITSRLKNAKQHQLDTIINQTLSSFKNQKINKIIFTSPINNRIGKTTNKPQMHKSEQKKKQYFTLSNSLTVRTKKVQHPFQPSLHLQFNHDFLEDFQRYQQYYTPREIQKSKKKVQRKRPIPRKDMKNRNNERVSPWRDDQGEGQLNV